MNEKTSELPAGRNPFFAILTILLLTALLAPAAKASELVILYSNDIRGETDPCG